MAAREYLAVTRGAPYRVHLSEAGESQQFENWDDRTNGDAHFDVDWMRSEHILHPSEWQRRAVGGRNIRMVYRFLSAVIRVNVTTGFSRTEN